MKTVRCDLCEVTADGETFEDWMKNLMPHYMEKHSEVMKDPSKTEEDKMKWMEENRVRFDSAQKQRST